MVRQAKTIVMPLETALMAQVSPQKISTSWLKGFLKAPLLLGLALPTFARGEPQAPQGMTTASENEAKDSHDPLKKENHGPPTREVINREEMHRWERHIRGFRSEHNFALSAGITSGTWKVRRLGAIASEKFKGSGFLSRFQYSFHLQLYRGLGYLVGSSLGYHYESADLRQDFRPTPAVQFPGLLAGLVLNINPMLRTSMGMETYLERHDGIDAGQGDEATSIYVTLKVFDFGMAVDFFYDLLWALRLEAHKRHLTYDRPIIPGGQSQTSIYPVDAAFSKEDDWVGVGIVFHLL